MSMRSEWIGKIIDRKLELADKLVERLPEGIRKEISEFGTDVLSCLNEKISEHLERSPKPEKTGGVRRINLE